MRTKILLGLLSAVILAVAPMMASAATFQAEQNYSLGSSAAVNDNLYAAGADVNVAGKVTGDLFTAGANVGVSGSIGQDALAVGGTVSASGPVAGNLRVAGGNILISSAVGGETLAAGGSVNYSGSTAKNAYLYGGKVYINGTVDGNLEAAGKEVTLGPSAVISGNFSYSSPAEAVIEKGAVVKGETNFTKTEVGQEASHMFWQFVTFSAVLKFLAIILGALIALYAFRRGSTAVAEKASSDFWREAGRGFVIMAVLSVFAVVCFISLIGAPLGILAIFLCGVVFLSSIFLSPLVFARLCMKHIFKKADYEMNWWMVILSVLVLALIALIPIAGWIFTVLLFLASYGTLATYLYGKLKA